MLKAGTCGKPVAATGLQRWGPRRGRRCGSGARSQARPLVSGPSSLRAVGKSTGSTWAACACHVGSPGAVVGPGLRLGVWPRGKAPGEGAKKIGDSSLLICTAGTMFLTFPPPGYCEVVTKEQERVSQGDALHFANRAVRMCPGRPGRTSADLNRLAAGQMASCAFWGSRHPPGSSLSAQCSPSAHPVLAQCSPSAHQC